jgi:hypothetical protein
MMRRFRGTSTSLVLVVPAIPISYHLPDVHLFFRAHHRSRSYGVIISGKTGSNHLGMGLRIDLR